MTSPPSPSSASSRRRGAAFGRHRTHAFPRSRCSCARPRHRRVRFGLVDFRLYSQILDQSATLGCLVLFTRRPCGHGRGAATPRARWSGVGPGTLVTAALIAVAAWALLGLARRGGDPRRGARLDRSGDDARLLRSGDVPAAARQVLSLESGLNDLVLLPIVLGRWRSAGNPTGTGDGPRSTCSSSGRERASRWGSSGSCCSTACAAGSACAETTNPCTPLGLAFTAYAVGKSRTAAGFSRRLPPGSRSRRRMRSCATASRLRPGRRRDVLAVPFVAFGSSLIWTGSPESRGAVCSSPSWRSASAPRCSPWRFQEGLDPRSRRLIVWFGHAASRRCCCAAPCLRLPGADRLFAPAALVVLLSVVVHGGALMLGGSHAARLRWCKSPCRRAEAAPSPSEAKGSNYTR